MPLELKRCFEGLRQTGLLSLARQGQRLRRPQVRERIQHQVGDEQERAEQEGKAREFKSARGSATQLPMP